MNDGRIHVLDVKVGAYYRHSLDGPIYRAVEVENAQKVKLRRARLADGTVIRLASTPDYSSRVIPCDERGNPR